MNTILEPSLIFISDLDWQDVSKRDAFLNYLLAHLDVIDSNKITRFYWTNRFEALTWGSRLPPWRKDKDWKNRLIPTIYKKFVGNKQFIDIDDTLNPCCVKPEIKYNYNSSDIYNYFLTLIHNFIHMEKDFILCLGVENKLMDGGNYCFTCSCHSFQLIPKLINSPGEWLKHIDLEHDFWPQNTSSAEIKKFETAVNIMRKRNFMGKPFIYEIKFTDTFIKDIIKENSFRSDILSSMVDRLTSTRAQAASNPKLLDECIRSKNTSRFRVTQRPSSKRIQYNYINNNKVIVFLRYGSHDTGL